MTQPDQTPATTEQDSATQPLKPAPSQKTPRKSSGCVGRFVSAVLIIIITTIVAAGAVLGLLYWLGYAPETPQTLSVIQLQLATAQAQSAALESQTFTLQTTVAEQTRQGDTVRETVDELQKEFSDLNSLRAQLQEGESAIATAVAESRESRFEVQQFATAEAGRVALLNEINRRSLRVERFLQRLGDISNDAAQDLQEGTALPTELPATEEPEATPTAVPTATPTAMPTATSTTTP